MNKITYFPFYLILLLLGISSVPGQGQTQNDSIPKTQAQIRREQIMQRRREMFRDRKVNPDIYLGYNWSVTKPFYTPHANGYLDILIPYTSTDANSGTSHQSVFSAHLRNPWYKEALKADLYMLEVGGKKNFFRLGMTLQCDYGNVNNHSYYGLDLTFGYGRNIFPASVIGTKEESTIVIKPFINFEMSMMNFFLGTIDNTNQDVKLMGLDAQPTFYPSNNGKSNSNTSSTRVNATGIEIYYNQSCFSLVPGISIAGNPYKGRFHWEISASCMLPFAKEMNLTLNQVGTGNTSSPLLGTISVHDNQFTTLLNGKPIHNTAFSPTGFYAGFGLGYYYMRYKNKQNK